MTIEKTTLTVSSDKLPGTDMPDGTASAHKGGTNGALHGYGENWGGNPWRAKGTEPEGKGDMWALDTEPTEKEPADTISASDLMQGYADVTPERTPTFNRDDTGGKNRWVIRFFTAGCSGVRAALLARHPTV